MSKKSRAKKHQQTIDVGYWMAVTLPADIAPLRSYVGQVQAVDEQGIRLALIGWPTEMAPHYDLFIPWVNLDSALVATPDHDERLFAQEAAKWQEAMRGQRDHVEGTVEDTQTDTSVSG